MLHSSLDALLDSLDVQLRSFTACKLTSERAVLTPAQCVSVYYATDGDGWLRWADGRQVELRPDTVVIASTRTRQFHIIPSNASLALLCCSVTAKVGGALGLFDAMAEPLVEPLKDGARVRETLTRIDQERAQRQLGAEGMIRALMKQCLILIVREHLARCSVTSWCLTGLLDSRLARAVTAVLHDPSAPHSVADLAAVAGMSRSAFAKRFLDRLEQSPMEFVKKARLHHAAGLLSTTNLPVKAIAARTGYASRSHFSRAFRAAYAVEPSRFRDRESPGTASTVMARS